MPKATLLMKMEGTVTIQVTYEVRQEQKSAFIASEVALDKKWKSFYVQSERMIADVDKEVCQLEVREITGAPSRWILKPSAETEG